MWIWSLLVVFVSESIGCVWWIVGFVSLVGALTLLSGLLVGLSFGCSVMSVVSLFFSVL